MDFNQWMAEVDKELRRQCGLTHMDLPDRLWHDSFDDGVDPKDAARECLAEEAEEIGIDPEIFYE